MGVRASGFLVPLVFFAAVVRVECGPSHRLRQFLYSSLQALTASRYDKAIAGFDRWRRERALPWGSLVEEEQDFTLAEYILDGHDVGDPIGGYTDCIAALSK